MVCALVVGMSLGYVIGRVGARSGSANDGMTLSAASTLVAAPADTVADRAGSTAPATQGAERSTSDQLRWLAGLSSATRRAYEAETFFASLGAEVMPGLFQMIREMPPSFAREELLGRLFLRWGQLDGPRATQEAARLPLRERMSGKFFAYEGWAKLDPHAAWASGRAMAMDNVGMSYSCFLPLREMARSDLPTAFKEANGLENRMLREQARMAIIEGAADNGSLETLIQSALHLNDPSARTTWLQDVFKRWATLDPSQPLAVLPGMTDPEQARSAMSGFIAGWSEADPSGAIDYILDNPDNPLLEGSLKAAMGNSFTWGESDFRSVIESARMHGKLDDLAPNLMGPMAASHPTLAMEAAQACADEETRLSCVTHALAVWAENDFPAAARSFEAMPSGLSKATAFSGISHTALRQPGGPDTLVRWMQDFSGDDRVKVATHLANALKAYQYNPPKPLETAALSALTRAVLDTPDLPPDIREKTLKLIDPAVGP